MVFQNLTACTGNKRQRIENIDTAPDQDDHDVDMPGESFTASQLKGSRCKQL